MLPLQWGGSETLMVSLNTQYDSVRGSETLMVPLNTQHDSCLIDFSTTWYLCCVISAAVEMCWLVSTYVVCERLSVMHKQVSVHIPQTVNFCPNSPESPFLEFQTKKAPPMKNFRFEMTKVYSRIPPSPKMKNFRFLMTKVYFGIPPKWKTSDLRWPKFTL